MAHLGDVRVHQGRVSPGLAPVGRAEHEFAAHVHVGPHEAFHQVLRVLVVPSVVTQAHREHQGAVGLLDKGVVIVVAVHVRLLRSPGRQAGELDWSGRPGVGTVGRGGDEEIRGCGLVQEPEASVAGPPQASQGYCQVNRFVDLFSSLDTP